MEAVMHWINDTLAPPLYRITQHRWIRAIMAGFSTNMPLVLVGAVLQIVSNIAQLAAPQYAAQLKVMTDLTFGMLAVFLAIGIARALAESHELELDATGVGLVAASAFFILMKPTFTEEGLFQIEASRLGSMGLFVAIVAGLFTAELIALFWKRNWTLTSKALPEFANRWFGPVLPVTVVIVLSWIVAYGLGIDIFSLIGQAIQPLLSTSDTFPAFVGLFFFLTLLFTVGINGAVTFGVLFPLWFANIGENAALVAQGLPPVHINMLHTGIGWVVLGGTGATLTLNLLMLRSRSASLKALGRSAILPSLMNINEPLIFGLPIAFNPLLAIPFVLNGGLINPTLVYLAMSSGLVTKPFNPMVVPWLPAPIPAFLVNQDIRGVILVAVELVINMFVWYPFFKAHERQALAKEATEATLGYVC